MGQGPLVGVRVIDAGRFLAGPNCAQILGDLGADVIKIETPKAGDPFRSFGGDKYSPSFVAFNRSKRSVELDLKCPKDKERLHTLVRDADVFIENSRPGAMERLGFGYEQVRKYNSSLIYCSITGFGQHGPYAHRPAYDTVGQALSGLLGLMLGDQEQVRLVGPAFSDQVTSMTAASGILAALIARQRTHVGQFLDVSMLASMVAFLGSEVSWHYLGNEEIGPRHRPSLSQAYALRAQDDRLLVVHLSSSEQFWLNFIEAIDREDLVGEDRFRTYASRVRHFEELQEILDLEFRKRPRDEWLKVLEQYDVPHAPVYTIGEVFDDEQVDHLGLRIDLSHPGQGKATTVAPPVVFSGTPWGALRPPPALGEHTTEVLAEL